MNIKLRLITIIALLLAVFLLGLFGYAFIEDWSFHESAYMTIITISSVGFQEIRPLSTAGRTFTIILIILGMSIVFYGFTTITAAFVEGLVKEIIRRRKMERTIKNLKNHVIVCGTQDTSRSIIEELSKTNTSFVIVNTEVGTWLESIGQQHALHLEGNPSEEITLQKAGIEHARGLIAAMDNDTQNIFIVLTAREMNPNLRIISRVSEREAEHKFRRAGANAVVCPNIIGGLRLVSEIIRPTVVDFLDVMMRGKEMTLRIEQINISKDSRFVNKTLGESNIGHDTGVIIVAKKDTVTGQYLYNPRADSHIKEGDVLIALGEINQIESLRKSIKAETVT